MTTVMKIAVTYSPPLFKFEYRKGSAKLKYHKNVDLAAYIERSLALMYDEVTTRRHKDPASNVVETRIEESSQEITKSLVERYDELLQVPPSKIECLIKKVLMARQLADSTEGAQQVENNNDQSHVNMTIQTGHLPVSPLRERPKLKRYNVAHEMNLSASILAPISTINSRLESTKSAAYDSSTSESQGLSSVDFKKLSEFGDLNLASDEDLQIAKNEMNEVFQKVQVLPGDAEYVYDKRTDFQPDEESSWD